MVIVIMQSTVVDDAVYFLDHHGMHGLGKLGEYLVYLLFAIFRKYLNVTLLVLSGEASVWADIFRLGFMIAISKFGFGG